MKKKHTKRQLRYNVAIVGGGFAGLCVASYLIQTSKASQKQISVTLFDPQEISLNTAYNVRLPDFFKLNHEASYMGIVNPFLPSASYDDFFRWIQAHKDDPLEAGGTIVSKYAAFDLQSPDEHLPRSLYGHYLSWRLNEMKEKFGKDQTFSYQNYTVTNIKKREDAFEVFYRDTSSIFDVVVLSTGDYYDHTQKELLYSARPTTYLKNKGIAKDHLIGILGSSLSAIETALALADQGYKNVLMFSRTGRLPKVRGMTQFYEPKYINKKAILTLRNKKSDTRPEKLLSLIKKELDFAYSQKGTGWYQKKGINWKEIVQNKNPWRQLEEDIKRAERGEECVWRSVLFSVGDLELDVWNSLSSAQIKHIIERYATLILMHFSPMPLKQAKKLLVYYKTGVILLQSALQNYERVATGWKMNLQTGQSITVDHLIDARGYSQEAGKNPLISTLIKTGLVLKHPAYGIRINKFHQVKSVSGIKLRLYAIGTIVNGALPLKASTPYINQYAREIANDIVKSM